MPTSASSQRNSGVADRVNVVPWKLVGVSFPISSTNKQTSYPGHSLMLDHMYYVLSAGRVKRIRDEGEEVTVDKDTKRPPPIINYIFIECKT